MTDWQSGSYLGSQCVDNSSVAEYHRNHWQQVCDKKVRRCDGFLRSIAAVCTPRYTRSLDDVSTHAADNIIVVYVGIMIQITTIAQYTRRFLALSKKTSNYLVFRQTAIKLCLMSMTMTMITIYSINNKKLH